MSFKEMADKINSFAAKLALDPESYYTEEDIPTIRRKIESAPFDGKTMQEVMAILEVGGHNERQAALLMGRNKEAEPTSKNQAIPKEYFAVSCTRKDGQPDDNYVYEELKDAKKHFASLRNDKSDLYTKVELLTVLEGCSITVADTIDYKEHKIRKQAKKKAFAR